RVPAKGRCQIKIHRETLDHFEEARLVPPPRSNYFPPLTNHALQLHKGIPCTFPIPTAAALLRAYVSVFYGAYICYLMMVVSSPLPYGRIMCGIADWWGRVRSRAGSNQKGRSRHRPML